MANEMLTTKQVSDLLKVHENTVYRYLETGKLKGYQIGERRMWRVYSSDLDQFIKDGANGNGIQCPAPQAA